MSELSQCDYCNETLISPEMFNCCNNCYWKRFCDCLESTICILKQCCRCGKFYHKDQVYCGHCQSCQECGCCPCYKLDCDWCGDSNA